MIEITDLHIPQLDMYIDKKEAQLLHYFEPEPGLFIAESPNVILRALEAGYEPISILMEKRQVEKKAGEVLKKVGDIPIYVADLSVLTGYAVCHAAQAHADGGAHLSGEKTYRHFRRSSQSDQCRRHLPVGGSPWHGWHPFDPWLCRSFVSQSLPGQHGNGLSDSLDLSFQRGVV